MIRHMAKQEIVKMLTTREVAEKLDANPGTIRMWCINGTFPNAKQEETPRGPVWLIPETDLRGFKRRGPGRPSTKQSEADNDQQTAVGQVEASADEPPASPKRRASKRSSSKKGMKKTAKKNG